ncbi:bifunctional [glutamate--ammonia ligase]-adenylyl-L-tyrosine phosphorylase/[glutamate--ammonia-ligase] adenylyltransferase [Halomonas halocynthiae]|uniref:bifunctional [glutamate--ammonia ligase]-adenylyl-L-tyrosine phosphorylase/[glutamate--ammonia-ligase] adenylyltransferase n=1 Tax=Halomonas halocynthiae TaxID=176290 RepID=UPI0003FC8136|nr:bifunctional [glutamate--ammonia ligase]-adenylyl-L-tyrosine phosphorylase/[glutamate--ammonia-ligase] adenylyltransferase [Halomonas halocynthiae]
MALPDDFLPLDSVPESLRGVLRHAESRLREALEQADNLAELQSAPAPSERWKTLSDTRRAELARVLVVSDYVLDSLARYPELLFELQASGELTQPLPDLGQALAECLEQAEDEARLYAVLRRFRRVRMLGIIWRDLIRPPGSDMWATAAAVSRLAEVCLESALGWLEAHLSSRWGYPQLQPDGKSQRLVVLGMGKLGAGELNLSSDIDLIFAFPSVGETHGGRKSLEHQEYFTKLGQKLIGALDAMTADGFVFRVDMRLRPLGDGGPLVGSFASLASYYQDQGREWERYALLKARPVAGDIAAGEELLDTLRPFVYRKYIDFGAIESLRELKAMINREVRRKGMQSNIKLGRGGIREIEFVAQAFQLIRGGRDTELQVTSLKLALERLPSLNLLPPSVTDELMPDYVYLRDLEHVLQAREDRQTQTLPDDEEGRCRVAFAMHQPDWAALSEVLDTLHDRVRRHFDAVIADPEDEFEEDSQAVDEGNGVALEQWRVLWRDDQPEDDACALLAKGGFHHPADSLKRLRTLRDSRAVQSMQRIGYARLDALMPLLLDAAAVSETPDRSLASVLPLVEAVLRRTAYLALLRENPGALDHLMRLCSASPWIAEQLARHPILLDELLTPETLYTPADRQRLADELRQALGRIPEDDEEAQLEALRIFKHAQVLHVAASDIAGTRHLMKVSDYLTYIAEVILDAVLVMAWKHLTRKHGFPERHDGSRSGQQPDFLIVGYGKLGGIELGYGSDLDLVFLHDGSSQGATDGARPIDNAVFFTRLGQRIIHLLTAVTPTGSLYEVDMRLRPSGNSGLLVASLDAFAEYQRKEAWTWEHQALVRSRVVAGSPDVAERFEQLRAEVLGRERSLTDLRRDVVEMREKMRGHLGGKAAPGMFDLKHDAGGMVDIEFVCQFAVLAMAHETPELLEWSDNMRILDTLEASGRLLPSEADGLRDAYLACRSGAHRASLIGQPAQGDVAAFAAHREAVAALWHKLLASETA